MQEFLAEGQVVRIVLCNKVLKAHIKRKFANHAEFKILPDEFNEAANLLAGQVYAVPYASLILKLA